LLLCATAAPFLFAALLCARATSQTPASSSARIRSLFNKSPADRLVDQLTENAATFRATLPSLVAREGGGNDDGRAKLRPIGFAFVRHDFHGPSIGEEIANMPQ
jgi:hypothetical protein